MMYPKEVYSIREDRTRENMRMYEVWRDKVNERCEEIDPDYYHLPLRDSYKIRKQAEEEIGGWK